MTVSTDRILPAPWGRSDVTEGSPPGSPWRRSPWRCSSVRASASSDTKIDLHVDPARLPRRRRLGLDLDRRARPRPGRPVRRLPVADGAVLRARRTRSGISRTGSCSGCGSALVLALGCWGVVRLVDVLLGRPRGVAHWVAGALYVVNPYVVVFSSARRSRCSATRALPWLLLVACTAALRVRGALAVAGRVRAGRHLDRRRRERGGDGVVLLGPAAAAALRGARPARSRGARRGAFAWRTALAVAASPRCGGSSRLLVQASVRDRLPEVHRAGRVDLEHHEAVRIACA